MQKEQIIFKNRTFYFHVAVSVLLMIGVGYLPPFAPITPFGMRIIGIFIGAIYGWTFVDMLLPSLLGMCVLSLSIGIGPVLNGGLGNPVVAMMLLLFPFLALINMCHLDRAIAYWIITRKFLSGRPWLFSFFILLAAYVAGMINVVAGILVVWSILYEILDQFGFKPYDPYATLMMCGTVLCATLGTSAIPFKDAPLLIISTYTSASGNSIDFFKYICFALPIGLLLMVVFILICRFLFNPDINLIKNIDISMFEKNKVKLGKEQKIVASLLILFIVFLMVPSILPKDWLVVAMLNSLGIFGVAAIVVFLALLICVDGKPLMDFREMAKNGMVWDIFFLTAFGMPMASALTMEGTGVREFIIQSLDPLLAGQSGMMFVVLVMVLAAVLTNVANNALVALILTPIIYSFASQVGINPTSTIVLLVMCTHMAIITPAASPMAGMLFANADWIKAKDVYKYMSVMLLVFITVAVTAGYFWLNIIF